MVSDQALLSYARYGTQWEIDQRRGPNVRMMTAETYDNLPIEGIGPQPPATCAHGYIYPPSEHNPQGLERADTGWIAHFYLVSNYFYFPDPTELALVGQPPLKLSGPRPIPSADLPVTLYPHPSGFVGLVAVEGLDRPLNDAHREAYDAAMPLLDELSVRYDVPLAVAHVMAVGVPSGVINIFFAHHSRLDRSRARRRSCRDVCTPN